jgi:predicted sulfurtransferase
MSSRKDRRAVGKREFHRLVVKKRKQIVELHEQECSVATVASRVGLRPVEVEELVAMIDQIHAEKETS